jgi:hypothetical protein
MRSAGARAIVGDVWQRGIGSTGRVDVMLAPRGSSGFKRRKNRVKVSS